MRGVRIGTSVFFGLLALLLVVLWVRSYWRTDTVTRMDSVLTMFGSANGHIYFYRGKSNWGRSGWQWNTNKYSRYPIGSEWSSTKMIVSIPFGVVAPLVTIFAAIPWALASRLFQSFSLRTLLIVTALIALGLGALVWATG